MTLISGLFISQNKHNRYRNYFILDSKVFKCYIVCCNILGGHFTTFTETMEEIVSDLWSVCTDQKIVGSSSAIVER